MELHSESSETNPKLSKINFLKEKLERKSNEPKKSQNQCLKKLTLEYYYRHHFSTFYNAMGLQNYFLM